MKFWIAMFTLFVVFGQAADANKSNCPAYEAFLPYGRGEAR